MTEHIIHKITSMRDEKALCGLIVKERREGKDHMTLFGLNITCPKCRKMYDMEMNDD